MYELTIPDFAYVAHHVPSGVEFPRTMAGTQPLEIRPYTRLRALEMINGWNRMGRGEWVYTLAAN